MGLDIRQLTIGTNLTAWFPVTARTAVKTSEIVVDMLSEHGPLSCDDLVMRSRGMQGMSRPYIASVLAELRKSGAIFRTNDRRPYKYAITGSDDEE